MIVGLVQKAYFFPDDKYIADSIPDLETLEIHTPQQLEDAVINLTDVIHNGIEECIPETEIRIKNNELPEFIRHLISEKNRLRRSYTRHRNRDTKRRINALQTTISEEITHWRASTWDEKLSQLKTQDNSLWDLTKAITRKPIKIPPLQIGRAHV